MLYKNTLLLRLWHFSNNDNLADDARLTKINPLLTHLNDIFKYLKSPGQDVVIDKSLVPFKGRLLFKQYLPKKSHKYGVKLFKICDPTGYTYRIMTTWVEERDAMKGYPLPSQLLI